MKYIKIYLTDNLPEARAWSEHQVKKKTTVEAQSYILETASGLTGSKLERNRKQIKIYYHLGS